MKHLGDITKLNGAAIPAVDVITGGSPCQDLSIAGRREGLAGERSGLFMDQVRIVKEMRREEMRNGKPSHLARPRYLVWENVPGAFSSNKGRDFQAVLTEIVRIVEECPDVPLPEKGSWPKSGRLYDELGRWSVAWRVHDAQFWGVPQRRKRIALVADFGGLSAPEVLFERKGLSWDSGESGTAGEEAAAGTGGGAYCAVSSIHQNASGEVRVSDVAYTIGTNSNASGRNTPMVYDARGNGDGKTVCTITGDHENRVTDYTALCVNQTVRRLTPLECERLQGFPDGWTDISDWTDSKGKTRKTSDTARYKALGNSIALPFWKVLLKRISAQYDRDATLGSLFDGIGGFPYLWEQINGKGSALWASEIDEFPIAVTKYHFPEEEP